MVSLRNEALEVIILPAKGADIYSITDRDIGVDVGYTVIRSHRPPPAEIRCVGSSVSAGGDTSP